MKKLYLIALLPLLMLAHDALAQVSTYRNPVVHSDFPDPTVIRVGDMYYTAGTSNESAPPYRVYESTDLVNWSYVGPIFNEMPEWTMGSYWAPELFYHNNTYFVYYTARRKSDQKSFIGVASTTDIHKGFTDHGLIIEWTNEAIDAFVIELDGKLYITWKAYGLDHDRIIQILGAELADDGLSVKGEAFTMLEANVNDWELGGIEGQCLVKHDDYIYMFYAGNGCCGIECDYMIGVARAKDIKGPWERYSGNPIMVGDDQWRCPGHGTLVETPDNRYFFMYHAYNTATNVYTGRQGMMDEVLWNEKTSWPYFRYGRTPSLQAETPFPGTVQNRIADFVDTFSSSQPDGRWIWTAPQPKPQFTTGNNRLELQAGDSPNGSYISIRPERTQYRFIATVEASPAAAGICFTKDRNNQIGLSVNGDELELWRIIDGKYSMIMTRPLPSNTVTIFLEMNHGFTYQLGYIDADNETIYMSHPAYIFASPPNTRYFMPGLHSRGTGEARFKKVEVQY